MVSRMAAKRAVSDCAAAAWPARASATRTRRMLRMGVECRASTNRALLRFGGRQPRAKLARPIVDNERVQLAIHRLDEDEFAVLRHVPVRVSAGKIEVAGK